LQRRSSRCSSWTSTIGSISQMMFSWMHLITNSII
jgi:hypothetical protein